MTIYNPHLLGRHDLIETFVARQPLLDELLEDLRRGGGQHHLLIGNRGSGKTTLLLRLAAAIEDDPRLGKTCIPLRFPEEQYNVAQPSDFWMNAIDALIDALERRGDRAAANRLEARLVELEPLEEDVRAKQSLAVLERWARQARRLIVLLVDNLDLVLDRLADSLWELREALSVDNGLVIIGASSKFLEEAIDYQSPFYEFFHPHELGPLSEDEARSVVLSLARRACTPRVAEVLDKDPGRFKALYVLTGGTPRTLALLHTVLALDTGDRVERDLDGLLDQLTPYYKARFDDLAPQSQLVVDKVALHWHPITAAECQAATHLDINTVSAQLNRLVKNGLLSKVSLPGPKKLGFQLTERFFNIWYLMRASRRLRRRLSWFVEFLRIFYGEQDVQRRAEELIRAAPPDSLDTPAKFLAFASAVPDESLRRRLEFRAIGLLLDKDVAAVREIMDFAGEDRHLLPVLDRARALREVRAQIIGSRFPWPPGLSPESIADAIARNPILSLEAKRKIAAGINQGYRSRRGIGILLDVDHFESAYGKRLLDSIANGELPGVCDITMSDIRVFIEFAGNPSIVVSDIMFYNEENGTPLSIEMLRELIDSSPEAAPGFLMTALELFGRDDWDRLRQLLLPLLRRPGIASQLGVFVPFLASCAIANRGSAAAELIREAGLTEHWTPIYEALRAYSEGQRSCLDALAPEMRTPALKLFDVFSDLEEEVRSRHASTGPHAEIPADLLVRSPRKPAAAARPPAPEVVATEGPGRKAKRAPSRSVATGRSKPERPRRPRRQ